MCRIRPPEFSWQVLTSTERHEAPLWASADVCGPIGAPEEPRGGVGGWGREGGARTDRTHSEYFIAARAHVWCEAGTGSGAPARARPHHRHHQQHRRLTVTEPITPEASIIHRQLSAKRQAASWRLEKNRGASTTTRPRSDVARVRPASSQCPHGVPEHSSHRRARRADVCVHAAAGEKMSE